MTNLTFLDENTNPKIN